MKKHNKIEECKGCINEDTKSNICSGCLRNFEDRFIYKDKIVVRYVVMKGNIFIGAFRTICLAKEKIKNKDYRIAKMVEKR